jgi:hypothetical protein
MRKTVSQADLDEIEEICYNDGYEIDDIQDAMTVLADDLVKEITEDFEPDILKGVKFIEYQIKFKQDNNEYDIDTPVEPIDTGMPEDCSFYEAKQYLNSKGYILVESKTIPKMDKLQELQLKEMLIDFWPFYCGAVDVGKSGLSSNPKAQRRHDKIYAYVETIFGDDTYYVVQGLNIYFQDVQKQFEDKLWEDNVNNVQRWPSDHCNGAIMQLAKMSLNDTIDAIKKADLNKLAAKEIKKWSH